MLAGSGTAELVKDEVNVVMLPTVMALVKLKLKVSWLQPAPTFGPAKATELPTVELAPAFDGFRNEPPANVMVKNGLLMSLVKNLTLPRLIR